MGRKAKMERVLEKKIFYLGKIWGVMGFYGVLDTFLGTRSRKCEFQRWDEGIGKFVREGQGSRIGK